MNNMDARFDRLEQKLDKLADAMVMLIEHDTKLDGLYTHNVTQDKRLDNHSERMDSIKTEVIKNSGATRIAERVFFIVLAAGLSFIAYSVRG